ncbi:redox-regulated ATPase YchF [candidate division KSB1 bacterium 4484_188]|nr:MAG: redox-regulated ATPase YchF [candidate division KSB1 bacterium 4484_188]HFE65534.1 redox-regulated ATPase YchF [Caldithrix sp.]
MEIGIIGLPFSGKTTLFSTLTGLNTGTTHTTGKIEVHRGMVKVPDLRLDRLTEIFKPKKQVNATIEYLEVGGVEKEAAKGKGFDPRFLAVLKNTDVLCHVVRAFEDEVFPHPEGSINTLRDVQIVETEFILSDLTIVENRISRLEKQIQKVKSDEDIRQLALLKKCRDFLEQERPLRDLEMSDDEKKQLRGFQFLSAKPLILVVNYSEADIVRETEMLASLAEYAGKPHVEVTGLCAKVEYEISQLADDDRQVFLEELGITEPALDKLIRKSYQILGLISFFTVGDDECRAWTIRRGTVAQAAAGEIHSDLERGFIRAEVVSFDRFIELGSLAKCREHGILRLEGKEYVVQDGDIITVRFNV